jgi:tetratricopeptide (TPR) repeat protein
LEIFRGLGDKKSVATALLAVVSADLYSAEEGAKDEAKAAKDVDEAKTMANEALTIYKELGDKQGEGLSMHGLACTRALSGNIDAALRAGKEALTIFKENGLKKREAAQLVAIASWQVKDGDPEEGRLTAEEALDIYCDDIYAGNGEASCMQTLVDAYISSKEPKKALRVAADELDRFAECGNIKGEAAAHEMIMRAYSAMENPYKGISAAMRATTALEEAGDKLGQGRLLRQACKLCADIGQYDKALKKAEESLQIFEDLDDMKEQAMTLQSRAEIYALREEHDKAQRCATEARELFQDAKVAEGEASALLLLAKAQMAMSDFSSASTTAVEAQVVSAEAGDTQGEANAYHMLVNIQMQAEDFDASMRALTKLLSLEKELGHKNEEIMTIILMAKARIMMVLKADAAGTGTDKGFKDGYEKSLKEAKDALSMGRKTGERELTGSALNVISTCQVMAGKLPEGLKAADESIAIFNEGGLASAEASSLILKADILMFSKELQRARESAEEGIWLFQQASDEKGESFAWNELERIDAIEAEERQKALQAQQAQQQQQWQPSAEQMAMWQNQNQGFQPQEEQQQPSAAGPGYTAELKKLDLSGGVDAGMIKTQILETAKGLVGYDEDIEFDAPLMESGLTSNTAVLLRDALTTQLPGISLPVTLVFDYPSISSMTELVMEKSAKAAKKALKK